MALRAHDPLPGDHRRTFGDDRSSDLSRERRLSEQLRSRLPRALRRPRDLSGHPHRSRPGQQGEYPAGRHPAPGAGTDRFHGRLGYGRRGRSRSFERFTGRLRHQRHQRHRHSRGRTTGCAQHRYCQLHVVRTVRAPRPVRIHYRPFQGSIRQN